MSYIFHLISVCSPNIIILLTSLIIFLMYNNCSLCCNCKFWCYLFLCCNHCFYFIDIEKIIYATFLEIVCSLWIYLLCFIFFRHEGIWISMFKLFPIGWQFIHLFSCPYFQNCVLLKIGLSNGDYHAFIVTVLCIFMLLDL